MLHPKYLAITAMVLVASCDAPTTGAPQVTQFEQPMSVTDAVQWLQTEGYDVLAVDRTTMGKLAISSRSTTHQRKTVLDGASFEVLEDTITPLEQVTPTNGNSDDRARATAQARSDGRENRTATAAVLSTGPNASVTGRATASTADGRRVSAQTTARTETTSREETTTSSDGSSTTRRTTTSTASGTAISSAGG